MRGHIRDLQARHIPDGGKTVTVDDSDYAEDGRRTREATKVVDAPYCYRTEIGKWMSCDKESRFNTKGRGIAIKVHKYATDGKYMGGPFTIHVASETGLYI